MDNFKEKVEVKKGDYGEDIVDKYFTKRGYVPYKPDADQPHPFDRIYASKDKTKLIIVEVKSKAKRKKYPDTGINISVYDGYLQIMKDYRLHMFIAFVDEEAGEVYGGFIGEIDKDHVVEHEYPSGLKVKGKVFMDKNTLQYPMRWGEIIYFPCELMRHVAYLNSEDITILRALTTKSECYLPTAEQLSLFDGAL